MMLHTKIPLLPIYLNKPNKQILYYYLYQKRRMRFHEVHRVLLFWPLTLCSIAKGMSKKFPSGALALTLTQCSSDESFFKVSFLILVLIKIKSSVGNEAIVKCLIGPFAYIKICTVLLYIAAKFCQI